MIPDVHNPDAMSRVVDFLLYGTEALLYHPQPGMVGGDAAGIEGRVSDYIEIWALIMNKWSEFQMVRATVRVEGGNPCHTCCDYWRSEHPDASDQELTKYVVEQWREIADRLGVPVSLETYQQHVAEYRDERGW